MKFSVTNLGCKVNAFETESIADMLEKAGYERSDDASGNDISIIFTCAVTNTAAAKSRQMIHRAKRNNPDGILVVAGCYAQIDPEALESADILVGSTNKMKIPEYIGDYLEKHQKIRGDSDLKNAGFEPMTVDRFTHQTRAYLRIQDGCNQFCSYCIIPYARGRVRSRRMEDVLAEIRGIVKSGYQEVVLTGIHISSYGIDFDGSRVYSGSSKLIDLLEKVQEIEGIKRIRIGSLEPRIVTEEFARRLVALDKVCPHFHLSLQSGCDATLKRMNRHYTAGEYYRSVEILRNAFERPAITTDVIVGFPQETEEEFQETKAFLEKVGFYEMHIFKYSKRKGTVAARMPGQLTDAVKTVRSNRLMELEEMQSREFRSFYIGKEVEVLFEESKVIDGNIYQIGHTKDYVKVALMTEENLANQIRMVKINAFLNNEILMH